MIKDPRSTKYIYNIQITAPPNEIDKGRHIVIGSDKRRNLKLGYSKDNAWIRANGPLKVISENDDIEIGNLHMNKAETILKNTNNVSIIDSEGKGFKWNNNVFTSNNGLTINNKLPINIDSSLRFLGGKSQYNPNNLNTQMPDDNGINNIRGDTIIYGSLNVIGDNKTSGSIKMDGGVSFAGANNSSNRSIISEVPVNIQLTQFPNKDGYNFISGDTNVDGDTVIFGNATVNKNMKSFGNITGMSLNVASKAAMSELEVNGYSSLRGFTSTKPIVIPGGNSVYNPNLENTLFPSEIDRLNYIRGDTNILGNITTPGDVIMKKLNVNGDTTMEQSLNVKGDVNITGRLNATNNILIPNGIIVMWSGSVNNIPKGWAICDGKNGTPNLKNQFIKGAIDDLSMNKTGGTTSVALQVANIPAHSHTFSLSGPTLRIGNDNNCWKGGKCSGSYLTDSGTLTGTTDNTGSGIPFDIMPPYYSLAFIMKIS